MDCFIGSYRRVGKGAVRERSLYCTRLQPNCALEDGGPGYDAGPGKLFFNYWKWENTSRWTAGTSPAFGAPRMRSIGFLPLSANKISTLPTSFLTAGKAAAVGYSTFYVPVKGSARSVRCDLK